MLTNNIIVLNSYFNFTNKSIISLTGFNTINLVRCFDNFNSGLLGLLHNRLVHDTMENFEV